MVTVKRRQPRALPVAARRRRPARWFTATVEEVWYVVHGRGEVWRADENGDSVVDVSPGVALSIETGCRFQFRNTGDDNLCILIVTMPPWPGAHEARPAPGRWPAATA